MAQSREVFLALKRWERALFMHNQKKARLEFIRAGWPAGDKLLRDASRDADVAETKAFEIGMAVLKAR